MNPVNDTPRFTQGANQTVDEDCGAQSVAGWAMEISPGPSDESGQALDFLVTNDNAALFNVQPVIDSSGKLTYTPAANANGSATVTVKLHDNGGGADTSAAQTFTITVNPVNDVPSFIKGADVTVGENTGTKTVTGWATSMSTGPAEESGQRFTEFMVTNDNGALFSAPPAIDTSTGTLTFTPKADANGSATVTVRLHDSGGIANNGVDTSAAQTFTIKVIAANDLKIIGTVSDSKSNAQIADATVTLFDADGKYLLSTTSAIDGSYSFIGLSAANYIVEVSKDGYSDFCKEADVNFTTAPIGVYPLDFSLSTFFLTLTADPEKILGDGTQTAVLTAAVNELLGYDASGNPILGDPISGVPLTFPSPKTAFHAVATTDTTGRAQVTLRSDKLNGKDQLMIPIIVTANDAVRKLYGTARIYEYFVPGYVEGVVTDGNTNAPVAGATVVVYKDFDGDGTVDFTDTQTTGTDGTYKIPVPKGDIQYDIKITKLVTVGQTTRNITVYQKVSVGTIAGSGSSSETYAPVISASGIAVMANADGSASILTDFSAKSKYSLQLTDAVGTIYTVTIDPDTGIFQASGLMAGATYSLHVVYTFADGRKIIVGSSTITISSTGEMNISQILIDPYGTITDSVSGAVLSGVQTTLYYANTAANLAAGIKPDTVVALPPVTGFAPANNANPQASNASGFYAFMVFPNTDYYIVAQKSGYAAYKSPTISVDTAIVNWDFSMAQAKGGGIMPSEGSDLAVEISSDRMKVEEGAPVSLTVTYQNKSGGMLSNYQVYADIPAGMTVASAGGGTVSGQTITWSGTNLPAGTVGSYTITLTAPKLASKEQRAAVTARIGSTHTLINPADDSSSIKLLLYSNLYDGAHKRYILGYPDGTFGTSKNLTRAETAAVFARLLDLDVSAASTPYSDIAEGFWGTGYIAAVSQNGLMTGYVNGTFGADKAITRAEFATMVARYFQVERSNAIAAIREHFSDTVGSWAKSTIDEVYRYRIINGYSDGTFKPNNSISRAEAVTMLNRMLYRGPLATEKTLFTDVSTLDWYCGQVMEAAASHSYTIHPDGSEAATEWIGDALK